MPKRTTKKTVKTKKRSAPKGSGEVRVRMYRHGLGDCHLVSIPTKTGDFHMLIDCGLMLGAGDAAEKRLRAAVADIASLTDQLDVVVATHEHWDHISGFLKAKDVFKRLKVDEVWMAWTENPRDPLAARLKKEQCDAVTALRFASERLAAAERESEQDGQQGDGETRRAATGVGHLVDFFGASGNTSADAIAQVKLLSKKPPRYWRPEDAPWTSPRLAGVSVFALGPPHSEADLRRLSARGETYEFAAERDFFATVAAEQGEGESDQPFDATHRMPLKALEAQASELGAFFQRHYYGADPTAMYPDQNWRRIDQTWLGASQDLALKLDNATNNTSLVLAIELSPGGDVLLFAADAQVGNWLTWEKTSWKLSDGRLVTGVDLLKRTVFYKVGHHGSHNATLRKKGLELMESDELAAFIPVDEATAKKFRWGRMPFPELMAALGKQTAGRVVRSDVEFEHAAGADKRWLTSTPEYYEFRVKR